MRRKYAFDEIATITLGILGILALAQSGIPKISRAIEAQKKEPEVRMLLQAIAIAENVYFEEHGKYCVYFDSLVVPPEITAIYKRLSTERLSDYDGVSFWVGTKGNFTITASVSEREWYVQKDGVIH